MESHDEMKSNLDHHMLDPTVIVTAFPPSSSVLYQPYDKACVLSFVKKCPLVKNSSALEDHIYIAMMIAADGTLPLPLLFFDNGDRQKWK
jgi:hypothetical protein